MPIVIPIPYQGETPVFLPVEAESANYVAAVNAAGGTVSTAAKTLLEDALTTNYNGLTYSSYSSKFRFLWVPLSDFSGIHVPLKGENFVNTGFVLGDWNIATGLQCGPAKHFLTGVTPTAEESNSTTLMASTTSHSTTGFLFGAYVSGASIVGIGGNNVNAYASSGVTGEIPHGLTVGQSETILAIRSANNDLRTFRGESQDSFASSSADIGTIPTTLEISLGALNFSGTINNNYAGKLDAAAYGTALTPDERISFTRMLAAIKAGRATL